MRTDVRSSVTGVRSWAPVALVVLVPLVALPGAFGPFHAAKWLLVATLVPAGLAVAAATGTLRWPRRNLFLVWIGVSVAATVLGVAPWMSLAGSPNRSAGLLALFVGVGAFVLGASVGGERDVQRAVLRAAFLAGALVGALGVAERVGLDLFGLGDVDEITRARSTWGSATFLGAHLVLVLPIAIVHLRSDVRRWRVLAGVSTAAIAAGLLASGTRAAWLASLVAVLLLVPTWWSSRTAGAGRVDTRTVSKVLVAAALAAVVIGAVVVPQLDRTSGVGRLDQWRTAVPVIADRPILGGGPDTQRVVLPSGIDESFEQEHGSDELHDRVHNLALDTLVTTGLLGLLALGALLVVLGRDIVVGLRRQLVPTAVAAGLAAYLVTQLFAFGDGVIDPIAWLLAGVLVVAVSAPSVEVRQMAHRRLVAGGFAVLALLALVWSGGEVIAEHRLATAVDQRAEGDLAGALDTLKSAATLAPARFDLDQIAARIVTQSLTSGQPVAGAGGSDPVDDALDRLDRAARIADDDPDLRMDRAELLVASGEAEGGLEVYEQVAESYPESFRAQLGIGLAAAELGQLDRAEQSWRRAAVLGPEDPRAEVNLGILYERTGDPDRAIAAFRRAVEIAPEDPGAAAGIARLSAPS